ncbi:hypothetical protein F7234_25080, partial [Pseudomonas putida]|uniref:hypothetical protein n=1 Tax=Pseudomonas putida TaxID=303 RepID=UPI00135E9CA4
MVEAKGKVNSRGFSTAYGFVRFGTDARDGLVRTVCEDIEPALSIVAGKAFEAGEAFDVARVSDFDIALAGQAILQRAQSIETGLMSGGTRTG